MKNFVALAVQSRFLIKLIFCIGFGSASSSCFLVKSVAIIL